MVQVLPPAKLAHVVLRSNNYEPMIEFYVKFLGARISQKGPVAAFLTYDEEHHRIAIINMPHLSPRVGSSNGLEHVAFTYNTLGDLVTAYKQRLELGIKPVWTVNHGATMSFYYQDPDGNKLEQQVNTMTPEEADEFMRTEEFTVNPLGVDVDPEELISRLEAGEDEKTLLKRPDEGPRELSTLPLAMIN
ncbi:Glyoxalase/Bleomycin resistance protein/Dihydroxybiphenyl dioxygenase [Lentithecium fluviatile CBS 122367]|uniref:Glyoxalase/Bleomycin resistance protein/Dihydroxybiphenyl dioxygenase n=1 Tax=Lentithecium fluviatile CBS 122367 TaxID=1168545 RepID=A0A6G1JM32_9PLEO|nr:Glyoxalase/Bleomycin resistance protein/Dihydroxybiphenyl dioxygenase [Lentithecium fluviatile CBS 122367]